VREVFEESEPEVLALPWSVIRRPVFWTAAVGTLVVLALLSSSYVPNPLPERSKNKQNDTSQFTGSSPSEPVRLTLGLGRSAYPMWTSDERIRFQNHDRKKDGESYIMDSNGTNQMPVEHIPYLRQGVWSPDNKHVLFWKHNDPAAYLAEADGNHEKKLTVFPGNTSWSADSAKLVFQSVILRGKTKDWEIFTYDLVTGTMVNVSNRASFEADPAFSPDGEQIVFNSNRAGNFELYLMNLDGSNVRRLTDHPAWDSHPVFSPDGTQIIFNSNRENENSDLYLMNVDGTGVTKLTNWESHEEVGPGCWSPDGTKIALISDHEGNDDVYVMNVEPYRPSILFADDDANVAAASYSPDGSEIVYQAEMADKSGELRIRDEVSGEVRTLLKTANANLRPAWAADGRRVVFQNKVEGQTDLFAIDTDGSNLSKFTNDPTNDGIASWSSDGTRIAYTVDEFGRTQIFEIDLAFGQKRPLTGKVGWENDPVWSPDGTTIAFACDREDIAGDGLDICMMDADGRNEKRLLARRGHDIQPAWSPDGSRLAFVASSDGNMEIYSMNADGSRLLRLTRNTAEDSAPHWSPDGTKIIFTSNRGGRSAIYEIEV
jgi:TolB protein